MPNETSEQSTEELKPPSEGSAPGTAELPAGETGSDEPGQPTEG